jgi:hypothetical protein
MKGRNWRDAQLVSRVAAEPKSGVSGLDLARAKQILERESAIQKKRMVRQSGKELEPMTSEE